MQGLIATKIGMSRAFQEDGTEIPVTYLSIEPNTIVRTRTEDKDGYNAIVLGVGAKKWKTRKGSEHTHYKVQKEFVVDSLDDVKVGSTLSIDVVPEGSTVTVVGTSKGKGFAGVIKRHNFARGPETHGSHHHREPGSVGMCAKPGRVLRGKKMPGRMGSDRVTLKNRSVVVSDPKENVIAIKGPIPGPKGSPVFVSVESAPES